MATEERVLCFERKLLEELGVFQGLSLEVEKYLPVVTSISKLVYLNRSDAEHPDETASEAWDRLATSESTMDRVRLTRFKAPF